MDLPFDMIPEIDFANDKWLDIVISFLKQNGYQLFWGTARPMHVQYYFPQGYNSKNIRHSVIHTCGVLVHNPDPAGGNIMGDEYFWIEKRG
jgi:hypothetical protein